MKSSTKKKNAIKDFISRWKGKKYEKGETQRFWLDLLQNVFDIQKSTQYIQFEIPVKPFTKDKGSDFIDAYIPATKVLIEQKSSDVDLKSKYKQSDGSMLTPYQQAQRYSTGLPASKRPDWIVTCNFKTFEIHDMEHPDTEPEIIELANLEKEFYRLGFIADEAQHHIKKEEEVSVQAGEIVGLLYDKILRQYKNPVSS